MHVTADLLEAQLEIADALYVGRDQMERPQDLPGRYGRVVRALDGVLAACHIEAVLAGGWAVWRHGYLGRVTQDVDIAIPADRLDEFLSAASVSGFEQLPQPQGQWPKLAHKETGIRVDVLPEGGRPGTSSSRAPTTIPHPSEMGAVVGPLNYISLSALIELKLAAGRARDEADVVELILSNSGEVAAIADHLASVHPTYVDRFRALVAKARTERDG
jgi:hypothetical protein